MQIINFEDEELECYYQDKYKYHIIANEKSLKAYALMEAIIRTKKHPIVTINSKEYRVAQISKEVGIYTSEKGEDDNPRMELTERISLNIFAI